MKRTHQCTLCNYLAETYGNHARLYLSNEAVFLYLLTNAQMESPTETLDNGCRVFPQQSRHDVSLEYTSAIAVMLAYSRVIDSYIDDNSAGSKILYTLMKRQVSKAKKVLTSLGFNPEIFLSEIYNQHRYEQKGLSFPQISEPTSKILEKVFSHSAIITGQIQNTEPLSSLGQNLGALIYTLDGFSDIEEDYGQKKYNPFLVNREIHDFHIRTPEIEAFTKRYCANKIAQITGNSQKIALNRFHELISKSLTINLRSRVSQVISNRGPPSPPLISVSMLLPFSVLALKAVIGQGETDGDMYDCMVWCCCDDEDPCPEPMTSTGEPVLDYAYRTVTTGGGAAVAGAGAGIAGGKLLSRRKKPPEPEEDLVYEDEGLIEPDNVRIVEIPDELPEVPELDRSKIEDTTVDPGYQEDLYQDLGGKPPDKEDYLPPDIGKPEYPEDIDDGVAKGGMDHRDVYEWLTRKRGPVKSPDTKPVFIDEEDWKSDDEHWFWKKSWNHVSKTSTKHHDSTPEERKAASDAMNAAGRKAREGGGTWGGKSKIGKALTNPTGYAGTGEGNPKAMLEQALRDRKGKLATKGWRLARGVFKMTGAGTTKTIFPKTRVPHLKNLGLSAMRATDQAKKIGQGLKTVRDVSSIPDGTLDIISTTTDSPYTKVISPDATAIIDETGIWQVDYAQQEAITRFETKYRRTPNPEKPLDVEAWKNMVNDVMEGE